MTTGRSFTTRDAFTVLAVLGGAGAAAWIALEGPAGAMPVHFGWDGRPDRWGDRLELAGALAGVTALTGVAALGCRHYARRADSDARARGLFAAQEVVTAVLAVTIGLFLFLILSPDPAAPQAHMVILSLLFIAIGGWLGRVGPNIGVGVRTPWTFKSRLAWDRSNRLAGRLYFWAGLAGLLAAPLSPQPLGLQMTGVAVLVATALAVFESWRVWRSDPDRQPF